MKKVQTKILLAIMSIAMMSCNGSCGSGAGTGAGNDPGAAISGNVVKTADFAPPAWIQGAWTVEGMDMEYFKFTSNEVIMLGHSLKQMQVAAPGHAGATIKESKKTNDIYEITMMAKDENADVMSAFYSFKRGDGSYIEFGASETGDTNVSYEKLYKK